MSELPWDYDNWRTRTDRDYPYDDLDSWWHQQEQDEKWQFEQQTREAHDMKVSELIPSKYLAKSDFDEEGTNLTIKKVEIEELGRDNQTERKPIMYFREVQKGMVLNTTALRILESCFGDEIDPWIGKRVIVYVDPSVSFAGRVVGGLRIRVPRPPKGAPAQSKAVTAHSRPEDEYFGDDSQDPPF